MGRCGRRVDGTESDHSSTSSSQEQPLRARHRHCPRPTRERAARRPQVDPFQPQILQPSPWLLQKQQEKRPPTPPPALTCSSSRRLLRRRAKEVEGDKDDDKDAAAGAADAEDEVAPLSSTPFDYDSIKHTPRFSVARALVEGEYYDRLCEESVSSPAKGKGPPLPHLM